MLKAAIEKIQELSRVQVLKVDSATYVVGGDGDYKQVRPDLDVAEPLTLHSLEALVTLIKTEGVADPETLDGPLYITVPSHTTVRCFGHPVPKRRMRRDCHYWVEATDVPGWNEKVDMRFDEAMIALRTRFQATPDAEYALKLLSDITTGSKITLNDNGIATSVVSRAGVSLQANTPIRPIISLRPYRTFQEVEQPVSQFLIRVSERGITFVEADGGMWKVAARKTVRDYLAEKLSAEIDKGLVAVAL